MIRMIRDGSVATVLIDRPAQRNALTLAMWRELEAVMTGLGRDPDIRAVLLAGAGGLFCAGADILEFTMVRAGVEAARDYDAAIDACTLAISSVPRPTVAVLDGVCLGGGLQLASACDFRVASPDLKLGIPATRLGVVYSVAGTRRLMALAGLPGAKRLLYSAEPVDAQTGQEMGLVDVVASDPMAAARALIAPMLDKAPLAIAGSKAVLEGFARNVLDERAITDLIDAANASADHAEAVTAFREKRRPIFRGL
jgi:enoyl-CoA hydratase/carnithine racemase